MIRNLLRGGLAVALGLLLLAMVAGCSSSPAVKDENPALTAKVNAAIADKALLRPQDVASVTSMSDGRVIVTLKKNSADLTGFTGADAASAAKGVGNATGDDFLALVPEATSVEVRDADNTVLATRTRK